MALALLMPSVKFLLAVLSADASPDLNTKSQALIGVRTSGDINNSDMTAMNTALYSHGR